MEDILRFPLIGIPDSQLVFSHSNCRRGRGLRRVLRTEGNASLKTQARVLHHLGVDFVTMRSRLEDDPRKNNGLIGVAVDQKRER